VCGMCVCLCGYSMVLRLAVGVGDVSVLFCECVESFCLVVDCFFLCCWLFFLWRLHVFVVSFLTICFMGLVVRCECVFVWAGFRATFSWVFVCVGKGCVCCLCMFFCRLILRYALLMYCVVRISFWGFLTSVICWSCIVRMKLMALHYLSLLLVANVFLYGLVINILLFCLGCVGMAGLDCGKCSLDVCSG